MFELMLCGGPPPLPQPGIFTQLPDIAISVGSNLGVIDVPLNGFIYLEGGAVFYRYNPADGSVFQYSGTALRNKNLSFSFSTLLADTARNRFYQLGSTAYGMYQPDSFTDPKQFTPSTNTWSNAGVSVSAAEQFFGYNVVAAKSGDVITHCGGFLQSGAYNTRTWNVNVASKTATNYISNQSTGPDNIPTAGSNLGGMFYVLNRDGKIRALIMGANNGWLTTVYPNCPFVPGAGVRAVSYGNKIYFYGGGLGKRLLSFSPTANNGAGMWEQVAVGGPGGDYPGLCLSGSLLWIFFRKQVWTAELDPAKWT